MNDFFRGRRLRQTPQMRDFFRETPPVLVEDLIMPYFVVETEDQSLEKEIGTMPGQYDLSLTKLVEHVGKAVDNGLRNVILFGIPGSKDEKASGAYAEDGIIQKACRALKKRFPKLFIITDVCLCEYMSHGHCGVLTKDGRVLNDPTLELLTKTAVSQAQAGSDMVAPSDMMDGRVLAIRNMLDRNGYTMTPIMSYAVKYASGFYGPFRNAADSAPAFGDRKTYQMDVHNVREALKEAKSDIDEGADILIVKPTMSFLDVLTKVYSETNVPICGYSVSGEYAMVKAAAQKGWIDEDKIVGEMAVSAYRAGASLYMTYYAERIARLIDEGQIG